MKKIKIKYRNLLMTFILMVVSLAAIAQFNVKVSVDRDSLLIGDQISVHIQVEKPREARVEFPVFADELIEGIEIVDQTVVDSLKKDKEFSILTKSLTITSFDAGKYFVPSMKFPVYYNQQSDTLISERKLLYVNTIEVDTAAAIKEIKAPYEAPLSFKEVLPYFLIVLGVAILALLVIYIIKKRKKNEPIFSRAKPIEPAHIVAIRELNKLKTDKPWQKNRIKEYYSILTDILREYLHRTYDIKTLERTSSEILADLKKAGFDEEELYKLLQNIFWNADLAKFAKYMPLEDENEKCLNDSLYVVEKTKPDEEEEKENAGEIDHQKETSSTEKKDALNSDKNKELKN